MTNAAQQLIHSFEILPEQEKHEVLAQLLRRNVDALYSIPSANELTQLADLVFQEYERDELHE